MRPRRRLQYPGRDPRYVKLTEDRLLHFLRGMGGREALDLVRLWKAWESVVGPQVAELARPVGHKDRVLILCAQDSIAAQELTYFAPEIVERANAFFGKEVFDKVRLELLSGRVPLDGSRKEAPKLAHPPMEKPEKLGGLIGQLDPDSAVGRCYLAYVKRFASQATTRPKGASRRSK